MFQNTILTSGHCCQTASMEQIRVVVGDIDQETESGNEQVNTFHLKRKETIVPALNNSHRLLPKVVGVESFYMHEDFEPFDFKNDLCLMTLAERLQENECVLYIK